MAKGRVAAFLADRLKEGRFSSRAGDPVALESYTLRTLALSRGLAAVPRGAAQRAALVDPYRPLRAEGDLVPLACLAPRPVSLVILCRPADRPRLEAQAAAWAHRFAEIILLVDGEGEGESTRTGATIRRLFRRLGGDFSAQRNAGQDAAGTEWVLQLDADETLSDPVPEAIGRVAAQADAAGILSIGLPRANRVDCVLSDLFPDIQYRLNRRHVRFAGRVHERPDLPRGWRSSFIAPNLLIEHHLTRAHVERRSEVYEALAPGKGRRFETTALLTPYRAGEPEDGVETGAAP